MIKTCVAIYKKNRQISVRAYPWSHIISRISGGIFSFLLPAALYYWFFNGKITKEFQEYADTSNYLLYMLLGQALNVLSFATLMNVGRCLILEIREGTLDSFLLSPASRIGYYIGAYIEQLGRSAIEFIALILCGVIVGVEIPVSKLNIIVIVFIVSSIAFFSVAIAVSTVMVYTRDTFITQNTIMYIMLCLCGVLYPIEYLPPVLKNIANIFPLTPAIKLFRFCILNDRSMKDCMDLFFHLFILSIVYLTLGYIFFRKHEKQLIENILS